MSFRIFGAPVTFLVIGCLLIAMSDGPSSWHAVVGFAYLALALVATVLGLVRRRDTDRPLDSYPDGEKGSQQIE